MIFNKKNVKHAVQLISFSYQEIISTNCSTGELLKKPKISIQIVMVTANHFS